MALVCTTRRIMPRESWPIYWALSFVSAGTIFIERPSRRIELALYVLPRAVDSIFLIATRRWPNLHVLPGRKRYALFAIAMGGIFRFYTSEPRKLAGFVVSLLDLLTGKRYVTI